MDDGRSFGDTTKARIFYPDGRIDTYDDAALALEVYYGLDWRIRAAFRAAGETTPVYPHDYVHGLAVPIAEHYYGGESNG